MNKVRAYVLGMEIDLETIFSQEQWDGICNGEMSVDEIEKIEKNYNGEVVL